MMLISTFDDSTRIQAKYTYIKHNYNISVVKSSGLPFSTNIKDYLEVPLIRLGISIFPLLRCLTWSALIKVLKSQFVFYFKG